MSHFTVAVFMSDDTQSVGDLIAPYDEGLAVAPYVAATKAEVILDERARLQSVFKGDYARWKQDPSRYESGHARPEDIEYLREIPDRMTWPDEKLYLEAVKDCEFQLNANGDLLSTYNPDSKWDWYDIGGRWQGLLILKGNKEGLRGSPSFGEKMSEGYDGAFVSDIDFAAMKRRDAAEIDPYEKAMEDAELRGIFLGREDYCERMTTFHTYAAVTPDGEWHAAGEMGWFEPSETPEEERAWQLDYHERFIQPAIENHLYMVIVDCHI